MPPSALAFDTLDDRRELHRQLAHLPPGRRVAFLAWCCERASVGRTGTRPAPAHTFGRMARAARRCDRADGRLTNAVYADLLALSLQYGLDLGAAAAELERWARGKPATPLNAPARESHAAPARSRRAVGRPGPVLRGSC